MHRENLWAKNFIIIVKIIEEYNKIILIENANNRAPWTVMETVVGKTII